jgi:hypothetical protein
MHCLFEQVRACLLGTELNGDVVQTATVVTRFAMRSADTREFGQLERNVFDDVAEVSTFFESGYKTARSSEATMMIVYSWKNCEESLVKGFELTTLAFSKLTQIQVHA